MMDIMLMLNSELLPVVAAPPGRYDGVLALDWTIPPEYDPYNDDTPIGVILHGLTGGSGEPYVLRTVDELLRYTDTNSNSDTSTKRMRAVVVNARGCGGSTLTVITPCRRMYVSHITQLHE
jgi:predicted alpha/beta-fold hydrolase